MCIRDSCLGLFRVMRATYRPGTTSPSGPVRGDLTYIVHGASVPQYSDVWRLWSLSSLVLGIQSRLISAPLDLAAARTGSGFSPYDGGHGRPAASADGGDTKLTTGALEGVIQRHEDAGAGTAGGMSEGDRAAMDVELVTVPAEDALVRQHLRSKGLVHLDEVHVGERHPCPLQGLGNGHPGALAHEAAIDRRLRVVDH